MSVSSPQPVPIFKPLLPNDAKVFEVLGYSTRHWELMPEEAVITNAWQRTRKQEFGAGRSCARRALEALGFAPQPILVGSGREPLFPTGTSGTITHTDDYCAAAVIRCADIVSIGIDAEIALPLPANIVKLVLRPEELQMLAQITNQCRAVDALVFSIKEAFFKAYFQQVGEYLDFLDARVDLIPAQRAFRIEILCKPFNRQCERFRSFAGFYTWDQSRFYCAIALPRLIGYKEK